MKTIIHFTNLFSTIKNVLDTSSLKLAYCEEVFFLGKIAVSSAAHPMVSFSEYELEELQNQTVTYGRYGIAFSEEWKKKKKIHPVLYIDRNSNVANALAQLLRARQNKEDSHLPDQLRLPIMTIKCFTKNAKGYNSYLDKHDFDFRSENELRYVPTKKQIGGNLISQHKSRYSKSLKSKTYYNEKLNPHWLKFNYSDIEKIFVTSQKELNEICDEFRINKNKIQISNWKIN